ncbi:hypothetical protein BDR26DRAFT_864992, partial [Obelidium mucronatum]
MQIVNTVCERYSYFDIDPIFRALSSGNSLNRNIINQMHICSQSSYLSFFPGDIQALTWLVAQDLSTQTVALNRVCTDWKQWTPSIMRSYSVMATSSLTPFTAEIFAIMDQCPPIHEYKATMRGGYYLYLCLTGLIIILLGVYSVFVIYATVPESDWSLKAFLTPFNISFCLGFVSLIIVDITYACYTYQSLTNVYSEHDVSTQLWFSLDSNLNLMYTIILTCNAVWAISYLYFSWRRSELQVRRLFPRYFSVAVYSFLASPLLILSPVPLAIMHILYPLSGFTNFSYTFQGVSACTLMLLDGFFLFCFMRFLVATKIDQHSPIDAKFLIISRYGLAATVLCMIIGGISVYLITASAGLSYSAMALYTAMTTILMHFVMLTMVLLKVGLYRQAQYDISQHSERIKTIQKMNESTQSGTAARSAKALLAVPSKEKDWNQFGDLGKAGSSREYSLSMGDAYSNISAISTASTDLSRTSPEPRCDDNWAVISFYVN